MASAFRWFRLVSFAFVGLSAVSDAHLIPQYGVYPRQALTNSTGAPQTTSTTSIPTSASSSDSTSITSAPITNNFGNVNGTCPTTFAADFPMETLDFSSQCEEHTASARDGKYYFLKDRCLAEFCNKQWTSSLISYVRANITETVTSTRTFADGHFGTGPLSTVATSLSYETTTLTYVLAPPQAISPVPPCCGQCTLHAKTVDLYFWPQPSETATPIVTGLLPNQTAVAKGLSSNDSGSYVDESGFTFISPSIYIGFTSVGATDRCGEVGTPLYNTTMAFDPTEISSVLPRTLNVTCTVTEGPNSGAEGGWGPDVVTKPLTYSDVAQNCSSIFGYYWFSDNPAAGDAGDPCHPVLAIPTKVNQLQKEWNNCGANYHGGFYDPPKTLKQGPLLVPTTANPAPTADPGQSPTTGAPATTKAPTALPETTSDPDPTSDVPAPDPPTPTNDSEPPATTNEPVPDPPAPTTVQPDPSIPTTAQQDPPAPTTEQNLPPPTTVQQDPPAPPTGQPNPTTQPNPPQQGSTTTIVLNPPPANPTPWPQNPGDPNGPNTPSDPSRPNPPVITLSPRPTTNPSDPSLPGNPSNPNPPNNPSNPDSPSNPSDPNSPSNPSDPNSPSNPPNPNPPNNPSNPPVLTLIPTVLPPVQNPTNPQSPNPVPQPSSNAVLIGTQTLQPGSAITVGGSTTTLQNGQTTITGGTELVLDPQGTQVIVDGTSTVNLPPAVPVQPTAAPAVVTVGGQTITAAPSGPVVIGSQTLVPGSTILVDGTTLSLAPSGSQLVVGESTILLTPAPQATDAPLVATLDSTTLTANSLTQFIIDSTTLTAGGTVTASGTTYILTTNSEGSTMLVAGTDGVSSAATVEPTPTGASSNSTSSSGSSTRTSGGNTSGSGSASAAPTESGPAQAPNAAGAFRVDWLMGGLFAVGAWALAMG